MTGQDTDTRQDEDDLQERMKDALREGGMDEETIATILAEGKLVEHMRESIRRINEERWPTRCADVTWPEGDVDETLDKDSCVPGTLIWQPKMGEGHVLTDRVEMQQHWMEEPWPIPVCECGGLDFLDHHWFVLAHPREVSS